MSQFRSVHITELQQEALKELINIGVGRGADVLNSMVHSHIELKVPSIKILEPDEMDQIFPNIESQELSAVEMKYRGNFSGSVEMVFPTSDASKLVSLVMGDDPHHEGMDEMRAGTLQEIGNVVLNSVMGAISNLFSFSLKYTLPVYLEGDVPKITAHMQQSEETSENTPVLICAQTQFSIAQMEIQGTLVLVFALKSFDELIQKIEDFHGI